MSLKLRPAKISKVEIWSGNTNFLLNADSSSKFIVIINFIIISIKHGPYQFFSLYYVTVHPYISNYYMDILFLKIINEGFGKADNLILK